MNLNYSCGYLKILLNNGCSSLSLVKNICTAEKVVVLERIASWAIFSCHVSIRLFLASAYIMYLFMEFGSGLRMLYNLSDLIIGSTNIDEPSDLLCEVKLERIKCM